MGIKEIVKDERCMIIEVPSTSAAEHEEEQELAHFMPKFMAPYPPAVAHSGPLRLIHSSFSK